VKSSLHESPQTLADVPNLSRPNQSRRGEARGGSGRGETVPAGSIGPMLRAFADGRLFGDVLGERPVGIVGLHGWRRDRHDLEPALRGLDAVVVDLPGFGSSPEPPEAWGAREYAALLNESLPEIASGPVLAVGHSFGGRVAVCAAAAQPDLYSGLVLTGVPLIRSGAATKPPLKLRAARRAHKLGLLKAGTVDRLREQLGSDDYRNAQGVMRGVLVRTVNESYHDELAALRCPVRLVWGADDTAAPVRVAQAALACLHDGALEVLDGVGHDLPLQAADRLRAIVEGFPASPALGLSPESR
jgi:pimeloyl-ACP methyl ester carboxylesterase